MKVRMQMIAENKTLFVTMVIFDCIIGYMASNIGYGAYLAFREFVCPH